MGGNWTHTFNATTISQVTLAYNTLLIPQEYTFPGVNQASLFNAAGLAGGFNQNPGGITQTVIPSLGLQGGGGYASYTAGGGPVGPENIFELAASVSKTLGKHAIKAGGSFYRTAVVTNYSGNAFNFSDEATWNTACQFAGMTSAACPTYNANAGDIGAGGDPVASLLLSLPISASRSLGYSGVNEREPLTSFFGQDTWTSTSKLTITYGLRWDYNAPITEANNRLSTYDPSTQTFQIARGDVDLPGGALPANAAVLKRHSITVPHYDYFQPRLGIAYEAAQGTIIRAGIGRTLDDWTLPSVEATLSRGTWPSGYSQLAGTQNANIIGRKLKPDGTPISGQNPFFGQPTLPASPFPLAGLQFQDTDWQPASEFQWNLKVQQELGSVGSLRIAYVGSETEHNFLSFLYNVAQPSTNPVKVFPDQVFGGWVTKTQAGGRPHTMPCRRSCPVPTGTVWFTTQA